MSEDDKKRIEWEIDKSTKEYSSKIDAMIDAKSQEVMTI
jgi:ribosome recycling factor